LYRRSILVQVLIRVLVHESIENDRAAAKSDNENSDDNEISTMGRIDRSKRTANVAAAGLQANNTQRNEGSASDGVGTDATMVYATTATIGTSSTSTRGQSRKIPERTGTIPEIAADSLT
jgi:hypothetical protein